MSRSDSVPAPMVPAAPGSVIEAETEGGKCLLFLLDGDAVSGALVDRYWVDVTGYHWAADELTLVRVRFDAADTPPGEPTCECNTGMACPVPAHWECVHKVIRVSDEDYERSEGTCDRCGARMKNDAATGWTVLPEQQATDEQRAQRLREINDAPAAPPEPPCRCGHARQEHYYLGSAVNISTFCQHRRCKCKAFTPARVPVNDEAEAAWETVWKFKPFVSGRQHFIDGFRAARTEEA